ncbi:DUF6907 domain-containing protein [Streptomyces sp. H39-C1]|uniref:DUF6907 domain-containing protein n=1 Tax=Streptomyces sp. H39-C1 TaxID=3004355 RepID=UPI0022AEDCCE|nr:hypothetical protein [Streptomyces sp. H39-C1]MCZ4099872.1 hypothetical protein [Streptomyces sp. H39-C1]
MTTVAQASTVTPPRSDQRMDLAARPVPACPIHGWCDEIGAHTVHLSRCVTVATPGPVHFEFEDVTSTVGVEVSLHAEDDTPSGCKGSEPSVSFGVVGEYWSLTAAELRAKVGEFRAALPLMEALASQLDGIDPEPAGKVRVTVPGARQPILSAEVYTYDRADGEDIEGKPTACLSVWTEPESEAELDVAGTDQLIADLEAALPRLRALRDQLAALEAGRAPVCVAHHPDLVASNAAEANLGE